MAKIKIKKLNTNGSALFKDSESYLSELTEQEMKITGGFYWTWFFRKWA
jgi:hypothetical protein